MATVTIHSVTVACLGGSEYDTPVRPIGVNGQEAWNVKARWFMYAPTFGYCV